MTVSVSLTAPLYPAISLEFFHYNVFSQVLNNLDSFQIFVVKIVKSIYSIFPLCEYM